MSRRALIRMDAAEARAFLLEQRTVTCATNGHDGFPHLMPLWYLLRDDELWAWTYGASQKVRNLERDPRATLQVEAGLEYGELRGIMLRCETEIVRDLDTVAGVGAELTERYAGGAQVTDEVREAMRRQAVKRVALRFSERDRVTWDHRKLAGTY